MRMLSARVKSYRTIRDDLNIDLSNGITLVGPNNAGKTNALKAIRMFFTGYDNAYSYNKNEDLSINQKHSQTSISITFKGDKYKDKAIYDNLNSIQDLLGIDKDDKTEFTAYLTFTKSSTPVYRLYPNTKKGLKGSPSAQYSKFEKDIFEYILDKFVIHYIPSDKSTAQLYHDLVLPFLLKRAFNTIKPHIAEIESAMSETAKNLTETLSKSGLNNIACSFSFPSTADKIFRDVYFNIKDPNETSIFSKGMGIQSAALLGAFNWITDEEISSGKSVVWLLEEPESYLHPELASQCDRLIDELRAKSQVVTTTHSLGFVPQDPRRIMGLNLEDGWTKSATFKTYHEATGRIRSSLGVKFSDYYNLSTYNVIAEGETDREYIQKVIAKLDIEKRSEIPIISSSQISILDQGGVSALEGFLRATYEFIRRERPCIIMLDGDDAGDKARRNLQGFFGGKNIPFQPNQHYISVKDRFSIEGLFPEEWIKSIQTDNPGWFADFSLDAGGKLQPFKIHDSNKRQFFNKIVAMIDKSESTDWSAEWMVVLKALEAALNRESIRIYGKDHKFPQTALQTATL